MFLLHPDEVFDIIAALRLAGHTYADDTQMFIAIPVSEIQQAAAHLMECIEHVNQWTGAKQTEAEYQKDWAALAWNLAWKLAACASHIS